MIIKYTYISLAQEQARRASRKMDRVKPRGMGNVIHGWEKDWRHTVTDQQVAKTSYTDQSLHRHRERINSQSPCHWVSFWWNTWDVAKSNNIWYSSLLLKNYPWSWSFYWNLPTHTSNGRNTWWEDSGSLSNHYEIKEL